VVLGEYKMSSVNLEMRVRIIENGVSRVGVVSQRSGVLILGGLEDLQDFVADVCGDCEARKQGIVSDSVREPVAPVLAVTCWAGASRFRRRECCRWG